MTYHVSPSPGQTQLREAVAMAMQYQNDEVLMEPGITPSIHHSRSEMIRNLLHKGKLNGFRV